MLSRAMGNDLVDYVSQEDHLLVMFWPPLGVTNSLLIKNITKSMVPGCHIRLNNKKGRIQIFEKKKKD